MAKPRCPGCSSRIRPKKDAFCPMCGRRNPLLAPRVVRRRAAVKSAGSGLAPVVDLGPFRRSGLAAEFYQESDPGRREMLLSVIAKSAGSSYAAVHDLGARTGAAWGAIKAECDPGRRQELYAAYFGGMNGGGAA